MSITALITGKLIADPERRTGTSGKTFTTFRLSAATDDDSTFVSGIAFGAAGEQIAGLDRGDTISVTGRAKPKAWAGKDGEPKAGLDVVADQVLTAYHLKRKRAAVSGGAVGRQSGEPDLGEEDL
jgi:single-stranded DNA-binding protein